jgi:hypothetical protein
VRAGSPEVLATKLGGRLAFLTLYAFVAIVAGVVNIVAHLALGPNPVQIFVMAMSEWRDGHFAMPFPLNLADPTLSAILIVGQLAPLVLIALAVFRGRRLKIPYLVVFPIVSLVLLIIGPSPFVGLGTSTAVAAPVVLGWIADAFCLYLGSTQDNSDHE